ncbi:hypothetical protein [Variovorax sp. W6]|uniref:hypothetical protein n=1 Tax=Variovorax sp. W6 TaxID=3093895 RepID=UPI003D808B7E
MNRPAPPQHELISFFRGNSGDRLHSRSVSEVVLSGSVDVPMPPARLLADWEREISSQLALEPGDVEALPLARARARWPDYRRCVQAVADWTHAQGLPGVLASSDIALMACRGAKYHHDGMQYGFAAFCNLFMSEDKGLDLHFPFADRRIPLKRGTVVIFDTGQPHAVIRRGGSGFDAADFADGTDCNQVFLTWELPIEDAEVARALGIDFDIASRAATQPDEESLVLDGEPAVVCPDSGRWLRTG